MRRIQEKVALRSLCASREQKGTLGKFRAGLHFNLSLQTTNLPSSLFLVCYIGFPLLSVCVQRILCLLLPLSVNRMPIISSII